MAYTFNVNKQEPRQNKVLWDWLSVQLKNADLLKLQLVEFAFVFYEVNIVKFDDNRVYSSQPSRKWTSLEIKADVN